MPPIAHLSAGQPVTLTTIHMLDANTGWGIGQAAALDSHILQTGDGGKTWRDVTPPEPAGPIDPNYGPMGKSATAFFSSAQAAWVAYGYAGGAPLSPSDTLVVWKTNNGGQSWTASAPLPAASLQQYGPSDLVFTDDHTGWLMAHVGAGMSHDYVTVLTSQDGGQNWQMAVDPMNDTAAGALPMSCSKTALVPRDAQNAWVAGDCNGVVPGSPYLYRTTDGGHTWQFIKLLPPADQPDLFTNENNACGISTLQFRNRSTVATFGLMPVSCNLTSLEMRKGWLYFTADDGQTWTPLPLPAAFGELDFLSGEIGWWAANNTPYDPTVARQLYQTSDGGLTWTPLKTLNWSGQLDFVDAKTGWAVATTGEAKALVQTGDSGNKWVLLKPQIAP